MRTIDTGHGIIRTDATVLDMARASADRAHCISTPSQRTDFLQLFLAYRATLTGILSRPVSIEAVCRAARHLGSLEEAAMIEAVASLRAEGMPL